MKVKNTADIIQRIKEIVSKPYEEFGYYDFKRIRELVN